MVFRRHATGGGPTPADPQAVIDLADVGVRRGLRDAYEGVGVPAPATLPAPPG